VTYVDGFLGFFSQIRHAGCEETRGIGEGRFHGNTRD